jgi:hypothetical protein
MAKIIRSKDTGLLAGRDTGRADCVSQECHVSSFQHERLGVIHWDANGLSRNENKTMTCTSWTMGSPSRTITSLMQDYA